MQTKHFLGDPHFFHERIVQFSRPYLSSSSENDETILENINKYVARDDILYCLGDFSWHSPEEIIKRIKCRNLHLIWGNHDKQSNGRFFKSSQDVLEIKIQDHKCWLSHYPHCFWPASHYGSLHLYGHLHHAREEWMDKHLKGTNPNIVSRRSMDVGVDSAWERFGELRPFNEYEVLEILLARPGHDDLQFYRDREKERNERYGK